MVGRRLRTPQDLGVAVRDERRARALTQAELARAAGVSREWLIGVEQGRRPRAELEKILAVLAALELPLSITTSPPESSPGTPSSTEGHESLTNRVTREAIEEMRRASMIPGIEECVQQAVRLLGTGMNPELAAHLTNVSMGLDPGSSSPAETDEGAP